MNNDTNKTTSSAPPAVTGRATVDDFERLHGLTTRLLIRQLEKLEESGGDAAPALLAQAVKMLNESGNLAPAPSKGKADALKEVMPNFDSDTVIPPRGDA